VPFLMREICAEERPDQVCCQCNSDHAFAKHQNVYVVVLDALMRGVSVMTHPGTYAEQLIRCYARSHAAPANQDAAFGFAAQNSAAYGLGEIRVVGRVFVERAHIQYVVSE